MEYAEILAQIVEVIVVRDICGQIWAWEPFELLSYSEKHSDALSL